MYVFFSDASPKFTLLEERSANGAPSVSVTFPNGHQDKLVLNRYDANDEDRMANEEHCNFIGHLENEPEACVAMTGCFGSEDVHLTILSAHATESRMFTWTKEGQVEVIDKKVCVFRHTDMISTNCMMLSVNNAKYVGGIFRAGM